jgi:sterol desaturase/sphingolipid hydroxylase (fatty acid hydroxylase superfamily)
MLYWVHRIGHKIPYIKEWHWDHHVYIIKHGSPTWHWNNLFLFNDTWLSTLEMYVLEVIPTLLFSWATGQWWIFIFYYVWAAGPQVTLEHHKNIDVPLLTTGKWHLIHHRRPNKNYGLFFPIWDILFGTYKRVDQ